METQENTFLGNQLRADQFIAGQRHSTLISIPLTPFSRGHIRAYGLSIAARLPLPANSGPASEDAFPEEFRLRSTLS